MSKLAKHLRKNQTTTEALLWSKLRNRQLLGLKFKRQFPVDHYVVDFCCCETRLIVEVDGDVHYKAGQPVKDKERQTYLESQGYHIIRFTNNDVQKNMNGVLESIRTTVVHLSIQNNVAQNSSPLAGEDRDCRSERTVQSLGEG